MTEILTPVGRLVMGHCFKKQEYDEPKLIKTGPRAGQEREEYFVGIAISKTNPGCKKLIMSILDTARQAWPKLFDENGKCKLEDFAYKFSNGDSEKPDKNGNIPCEREGFKDCYIFKFTTGFKPRVYHKGGQKLVTDEDSIKKGYYIRVAGNVKGNDSKQSPGLYLNHTAIEFVGYGEEIVTEPAFGKVFETEPEFVPPEMLQEPQSVEPASASDYMKASGGGSYDDMTGDEIAFANML